MVIFVIYYNTVIIIIIVDIVYCCCYIYYCEIISLLLLLLLYLLLLCFINTITIPLNMTITSTDVVSTVILLPVSSTLSLQHMLAGPS